jgi:hypothetical protein
MPGVFAGSNAEQVAGAGILMTPEEFQQRNNWTYQDGICPPCNCCPNYCDDCIWSEPSDECREWARENAEFIIAARLKLGQHYKLGYPCLRANLWLLGLPYVGVIT